MSSWSVQDYRSPTATLASGDYTSSTEVPEAKAATGTVARVAGSGPAFYDPAVP